MKNRNNIHVAIVAVLSISNASANVYDNSGTSETPFDVMLDTGTYSWSGSTPTVQSSDTTLTVNHTSSSSSSAIVVEETPAEVGVPGAVDVYQVTTMTTTSHDHTYNDQNANVDFNDYLTTEQLTPSTYELSGTITKQAGAALYSDSGWLNFSLGLGISLASNPGGIDGMLTFEFGSDPEAWAFSYTTEFAGLSDSIFLSDGEYLNLSDQIYFNAIYSITGSDGTPFNVSNIWLDVDVNSGSDFAFNVSEPVIEESSLLLSHTEIPALTPPTVVPVPAAIWLMLSGLLGFTAVARRKS